MIKIGSMIFGALLSVLLFSISSFAAEVFVEINPKAAEVAELVQVTLTITSEDALNVDDPRAPDFDGFELVGQSSGMGMSQRPVQTANGMKIKNVHSKTFRYNLMPTRTGQLSIGSFDVVVNGKAVRTQPQLIKVSPAGSGSTGSGGRNNRGQAKGRRQLNPDDESEDPFDQIQKMEEQMFNNLLSRRQQQLMQPSVEPQYRSEPGNPNEAFFVQVEVDKTEVYEWEPVIVTWNVYTRGRMESLDRVKYPDMRGFFKEIIEENPTIQFMDEVINGVPYKKAMIGTYALFPMKAGKSYIDEYKIKSKVALPSPFGLAKAYEYTRSSKKVEITVKPLPTDGRPKDFAGAVGNFEVQSGVEASSFPAHQPLSFRVRIEGSGNAKAVELPAINWPEGIEVFDTRNESKFFKNGKSFKEFEILLIPRKEGPMTLPSVNLSFFDPVAKKYYSRTTQPVQIQVTPGNANAAAADRMKSAASPAAKPETAKAFPEPMINLEKSFTVNAFLRSGLWIGLIVLMLVLLVWKARRELSWGKKKALKVEILEKRLKQASKTCVEEKAKTHGAEMLNIFYQSLGESNQGSEAIEASKLLEQAPASLRRDFGTRILQSIEFYQAICFAPEEMTKSLRAIDSLLKQYKEASELIQNILKSNRSKEVEPK